MKLPTSFRLPETLLNKLKARSENSKKSISDIVCEALNASFESETSNIKNYNELLLNPINSCIIIYKKLYSYQAFKEVYDIGIPEIKFIINQISNAYRQNADIITADYLCLLMDMTFEFMEYSISNKISFDEHYVYRCLDIMPTEQKDSLKNLKNEICKNNNGGYGEYLLRPLSSEAFELEKYPQILLKNIFSMTRLRQLFPLVIKGINLDMKTSQELIKKIGVSLASQREGFKIGELAFNIECHGNNHLSHGDQIPSIYLIVCHEHFILPLGIRKLLSILRLIKWFLGKDMSSTHAKSEDVTFFLPVNSNDSSYQIQIDAFRLLFSKEEFYQFINQMNELVHKTPLKETIDQFKVMYGDI